MKKLQNIARLLIAAVVIAAPLVGHAEDKMDNMDGKKMNDSALMEPVKSVYDSYLKIQTELVKDSLKDVSENATAIAKAVRGDEMKMLPAEVATQADALAQAKDLKSAREAFKPLSTSLIKYLADNRAGKGVYHEAYCPMAKASWLQTGKDIRNPYLGKEMPDCGELKN
jgi:Cu(I)/Ag(I) efflux system membrane fusion protein